LTYEMESEGKLLFLDVLIIETKKMTWNCRINIQKADWPILELQLTPPDWTQTECSKNPFWKKPFTDLGKSFSTQI